MKKIKNRHNKKRNTAFLYESLIRELVKSVVKKDEERKKEIIRILKEHFCKNSNLYKELQLYKAIYETKDVEPHIAEKLIFEAKVEREVSIDGKRLFLEQTALIKRINKKLSKNCFSTFVPNYKSLATIAQIFSDDVTVKKRVLFEDTLIEGMCAPVKKKKSMMPIDNIVYNAFIKKFNLAYGDKLLGEQKKLLENYILSFSDNKVNLKIFLNEEIERIKEDIKKSFNLSEIAQDEEMLENTKKVFKMVEGFREQEVNSEMIRKVLKIQKLLKEMKSNDD